MKYVSIDALTRAAGEEANRQAGWTSLHLTLRTMQENTEKAKAEFIGKLNPRIEAMLQDKLVTIIDEDDVLDAWRRHGLSVPGKIMTPMALTTTMPDGSHVILFNNKGLRDQGPVELEQVTVHEIAHLDQLVSGRLVMTDKEVTWEGKVYCSATHMQQTMVGEGVFGAAFLQCLLPWELEAYEAAYNHAVEYDIESSNRRLGVVLAAARAYHKWQENAIVPCCDVTYGSQVLSPYGQTRMSIVPREVLRNALLSDVTDMAHELGLSVDILGREIMHPFLTMDMEAILRIFLGYAQFDSKATGFFTKFFNAFPSDIFNDRVNYIIRQLVDAGK